MNQLTNDFCESLNRINFVNLDQNNICQYLESVKTKRNEIITMTCLELKDNIFNFVMGNYSIKDKISHKLIMNKYFSEVLDYFENLFLSDFDLSYPTLYRILKNNLFKFIVEYKREKTEIARELKTLHDRFLKTLGNKLEELENNLRDFLIKLYPDDQP